MLDELSGDPDLELTMGYVAPGYLDEAEGCGLGLDIDLEGNTNDNGIVDIEGAGQQGFLHHGGDYSAALHGGSGA